MALEASQRYTLYNPVVLTTDFEVGFPIFDTDDLDVRVDGVSIPAFTVSATFVDGKASDASIALTTAVTGVPVEIYGARAPRRENDYLASAAGLAAKIERDIEAVTATQQEQFRDFERAIKLPPSDTASAEIPQDATERANKVLTFDATGSAILALVGDLSADYALYAPLTGAAFTGACTFAGSATFADNVSLYFGGAFDSGVTFDGTDVVFSLPLGGAVRFRDAFGNNIASLFSAGASTFKYQNQDRLDLTAVGGDLTGDFTLTGDLDVSGDLGVGQNLDVVGEFTASNAEALVAVGLLTVSAGTPSWTGNYGFSASITDNGLGDYTVAFASAEADTEYLPFVTGDNRECWIQNKTVNGFDVRLRSSGGDVDPAEGIAVRVVRIPS